MGANLRNAGLSFEDLTAVFADVGEEIYNESCCHVNKEGNALLARAIAKAIATRLSHQGGSKPLALDRINFTDSLFAVDELRRLGSKSPDYNGGSLDRISKTNK
jgi:hypothetical protein